MTPPGRLPALIFDFGGVLMDWSPHYLYRKVGADDAAIARFLAEVGFREWNERQDAGRPFAEAVAELTARHPEHAGWIRLYDQRWEESLSGPIWPTVAILESLKQAGYPLYGLSNWSAEKFPLVQARYPFFGWFEQIVLSGEVRLLKPDPRIFALTLERIARPAGDCLLVDDSPANIRAAEALGFQTIHFQDPAQFQAELGERGLL